MLCTGKFDADVRSWMIGVKANRVTRKVARLSIT
jgi:hypothetical protein